MAEKMLVGHYLQPQWPAPAQVKAYTTTRQGGHSQAPYHSFNLAAHVGDELQAVNANRQQLFDELSLPMMPVWLEQVHGKAVADMAQVTATIAADVAISAVPGKICAVLTADCLPILLCHREGLQVAAVHAGWRGLAAGVIQATGEYLQGDKQAWLAWLGPGISAQGFVVDDKVYREFGQASESYLDAFYPLGPGQWQADLYQIACLQLRSIGITAIYGGEHCTYHEQEQFFSYRRSNNTGRMASLIWLQA
jgi:polyphenol oxidase